MQVRTRFAPSPTGVLHVGSVRTALFAWLYARHNQGKFILRIEDTDQERSTKDSILAILEGMDWLGLNYDTGPIYQTDRYARYNAVIASLLESGDAYRCSCSKERLENLRNQQLAAHEKPRYDAYCRDRHLSETDTPCVIRFKNPLNGLVTFTDKIYGEIVINNQELDDFVIQRSDGNPTYNFAVVVDDWDMEITHVIRGDDHINNTPKQLNLLHALGAPIPQYAHLPMILGQDGKRLSKRHGAVNVMQFKQDGILPEALLNYLVRLGWSHGDQEQFSLDEMIAYFDLSHVSRSAASFNYEKLFWLNQYYQKSSDPERVALNLKWQFEQRGIDISQGPELTALLSVMAERCKTLAEICEKSKYFYQDVIEYDQTAVDKYWSAASVEAVYEFLNLMRQLDAWTQETIHNCINTIREKYHLTMPQLAIPIRIAVTGSSVSPAIDVTLYLLGKSKVIMRLENALQRLKIS